MRFITIGAQSRKIASRVHAGRPQVKDSENAGDQGGAGRVRGRIGTAIFERSAGRRLDASSAALPAEAPRGLMEQPYCKQTAELA
jgi:hypothetical protein